MSWWYGDTGRNAWKQSCEEGGEQAVEGQGGEERKERKGAEGVREKGRQRGVQGVGRMGREKERREGIEQERRNEQSACEEVLVEEDPARI